MKIRQAAKILGWPKRYPRMLEEIISDETADLLMLENRQDPKAAAFLRAVPLYSRHRIRTIHRHTKARTRVAQYINRHEKPRS